MKYFLGIDVGSSKTHALITDETGTCVGFGRSSGGNHQGVGYDGLENVLKESFAKSWEMAGISVNEIAGAGFGIAGYDFPSERASHLKTIAALGLSCPAAVANDGVNGLLAGATRGIGVNVTAGSGTNCRGRGRDGREGRIVGNGTSIGEYGGGIEIAEKAVQVVNYAWIKRIPPTALTQIFLNATGARNELDLMERLSGNGYHPTSDIAIEVIRAAREGDFAAREVIRWSGEELGWLAVSVARQIEMEDEEVEIIQSGSVFEAGKMITQPMHDIVLKHVPKAKIIRLEGPPVVGAVMLGMEQVNFDGYAVRHKMVQTAKEIVS